jgi:four helix bundle protein
MSKSILKEKSYAFALRIVKLYKFIVNRKREYVLSKQVLRSGTSIGANVEEAGQAESRADFVHKLGIAQKEAFETAYWLRILCDCQYLSATQAESVLSDCVEIQKLVTASIKTAKRGLRK